MAKVKYLVKYEGPSYFSYDNEFMAGMSSLDDARHYFACFYWGSVTFDQYRSNEDRYYVQWSKDKYELTPATTLQDTLTVYSAIEYEPGLYDLGELVYQYSFNERGTVTREKF